MYFVSYTFHLGPFGSAAPISRSNFKITGRRTIIKIIGKMPSANGTTILTGNSFAFFSASNILFERISSLNSRSVVATSPPSSTECRKTATKDAASSNPNRSANALKRVDGASPRSHLRSHQLDVVAKRAASLAEPVADSLE